MAGQQITVMQRLSLYITLLLSVACLAYAEMGQEVQGTPFFYLFMFFALGGTFWAEDRFALSNTLSNALAGLVVLGGAVWLSINLDRGPSELDSTAYLTRSLVAKAGPILGCLLLAKLLRPKVSSDLWLLHLLGLVQVLLACVIAMTTRMDRDTPLFPVLLLTYLASLVWAHRWFFASRDAEGHSVPAPEMQKGWFSLKPLGWFIAVLLVAIVFFFSMPQGGLEGGLFQGSDLTETGASQKIDLNADGDVQISDEQVMRLWARNSQGSVHLPETLRLRGAVLNSYGDRSGEWSPASYSNYTTYDMPTITPAMPADATRFEFDIDVPRVQELGRTRTARNSRDSAVPFFLPDPPSDGFNRNAFSMTPIGGRIPLCNQMFEGLSWVTLSKRVPSIHIAHDYRGRLNANVWKQSIADSRNFIPDQLRIMLKVPDRIKRSGRIAAVAREALAKARIPDDASPREKAAALDRYLSSNEFHYTLSRPRRDASVDPTEDFLCNVKEGHCERFASALAIMLRSIGIPARLVMGYRGLERNELGDFYIIRQLHAHVWVEAIIEQETDSRGAKAVTWLVLDPSPINASSTDAQGLSPLSFARFLWEFFILDFAGQSQRARLIAQLQGTSLGNFFSWWASLTWWQSAGISILTLLVIVGLVWGLLRLRRYFKKRRSLLPAIPREHLHFFSRLLSILSRKGFKRELCQTPSEFAQVVQPKLLADPQTAGVAQVPQEVVPVYYAVRYGGRDLNPDQQSSVDRRLDDLQTAIMK